MIDTTTTPALNWWALALRGLFGIVFGFIAFTMPGVTLAALTLLFGAYALIDGILSLAAAFQAARLHRHWWALTLEGIIGIGAAAVTFIWPATTLFVLLYLIAAWAVITGVLEISAAIRLRHIIANEWLLGLAGVASILFGVLLFGAPGPGAIVIAWWIGAYMFVFGIIMLALAFRLRTWTRPGHPSHAV
jgi:uncharacterized membrane protein HdeD (DUF308 family)